MRGLVAPGVTTQGSSASRAVCGKPPDEREVDPNLQRRQRLASRVLSMLESPGTSDGDRQPEDPEALWSRLAQWLGDFLTAFAAAVRERDVEAELIESVEALNQIRADVRAANRLRPWLAIWCSVDGAIDQLVAVAEQFMRAAAASPPRDAQREAESAQKAIDAATIVAEELSERLARWETVSDEPNPDRALSALAGQAYRASGASDLLALDRSGAHLYRRLTGNNDCPSGLGIGLQMTSIQVETVLDEERFWDVARKVFDLLSPNPAKLLAVTASPHWLDDFRQAAVAGHDAGVAHQALVAGVRRCRDQVAALMSFGHDLVEGPGKRYIATILATIGRAGYEQLRTRDAGALLNNAHQRGLADLLIGLERGIRIARAHREFRVEEGSVVFTGRGFEGERMTIADLVDRVLAGLESMLALYVGIICAVIEAGMPLEELDPLAELQLSSEDSCTLMLALAGWDDPHVEFEPGRLIASGKTELTASSLNVIGMLLLHMPDDCGVASLSLTNPTGLHVLTGPLAPFRAWQHEKDQVIRNFYFIEGLKRWSLDGAPIASRDYVRKFAAVSAAQAIEKPFAQGLREVKALGELGERIEDSELVEALNGLIPQLRSRELGLPETSRGHAGARKIADWVTLEVRQPFEGGSARS